MNALLLAVALRFVGVAEAVGVAANPLVVAMIRLENPAATVDEIPWCSAFVNFLAWLLGLPRSRSLAARSWLAVGTTIALADVAPGDVAIFSRGPVPQPGPDVLNAQGHVAIVRERDGDVLVVVGGNQGDRVSVAREPIARLLGLRRLSA